MKKKFKPGDLVQYVDDIVQLPFYMIIIEYCCLDYVYPNHNDRRQKRAPYVTVHGQRCNSIFDVFEHNLKLVE
jgi:hypothetical protein